MGLNMNIFSFFKSKPEIKLPASEAQKRFNTAIAADPKNFWFYAMSTVGLEASHFQTMSTEELYEFTFRRCSCYNKYQPEYEMAQVLMTYIEESVWCTC